MNNAKNFLTQTVRKTLYYSFFYSHLSFGISLWGPSTYKWFIDKIQMQQKRALKSVLNSNRFNGNIFNELSVMNVNDIINFELSKLMFQVSKNSLPWSAPTRIKHL